MKTFQKIKSLDNQKKYFIKLQEKGIEVKPYIKGDRITITEKIDGANAQVRNINGVLHCYSHHKELSPDNTLNGFYEYVQKHKVQLLQIIHEGYAFFGEWLVPHTIQYPDDAYHKWYVFDVCEISNMNDVDRYYGFDFLKGLYNSSLYNWTDIYLVPEYSHYSIDINNLSDFDIVRKNLSNHSLLGAKDGKSEGIVVSNLDKIVNIDDHTKGALRIKCVNESFREVHHSRKPLGKGQKAVLEWANRYVTKPRIEKKIFSLQEDGYLEKDFSFEWMKNGNAKLISENVLQDALEESEETPEELKPTSSSYDKNMRYAQKFSNKSVNKFVALKSKGIY